MLLFSPRLGTSFYSILLWDTTPTSKLFTGNVSASVDLSGYATSSWVQSNFQAKSMDYAQQLGTMEAAVKTIAAICGMSSYLEIHTIHVGESVTIASYTNVTYHSNWDNRIGLSTWSTGTKDISTYHNNNGSTSMIGDGGNGTIWKGAHVGYDFVSITNPDKLHAFIVIP